jgi:hypothetical protein
MARRTTAQTAAISGKASKSRSASYATSKVQTKAGSSSVVAVENSGIHNILSLAEAKGLLSGGRTLIMRGRMPAELVAQARRKTGITSDTKLLEAALINIALSDDYAEWLLAHRGTVSQELDLEF